MAISIGGRSITGLPEKVLRDNHINPNQEIMDEVIAQKDAAGRATSMTKAHERYVDVAANGTAEQKAALPIYTDVDAMLTWHFSQPDYQDKQTRKAV